MNWILIIILALAIAVLVLILGWYHCHQKTYSRRRLISHFIPVELAYAQIGDPYEKPFVMEKLLSLEQCQNLINYAQSRLVDSQVVGGRNAGIRNSKQCWLSKHSPLIKPVYERLAQTFDIPLENAEDLQIVRYQPGQYYKAHHDSCCENTDKCRDFTRIGGQRKLTVLVYLNNDFEGGQTEFPTLGYSTKPTTGDAIVFYPLAQNSSYCHPLALHGGLPVTRGEKWVANFWFRETKFKD